MEFQVTVHALILFLTFVLAVGVAFLISWKITTSGSVTLVFMMVSIAVYALGASLEAAAQGIPLKIIFAKIQYAGFSSSVTLLLIFALQYTRHDDWLRKGRWMLLWLVPVLITLTAWTNEQHQFLWNGFNFDESRNILLYGHGPAYFIILAVIYLQVAAAILLLIIRFRTAVLIQRRQLAIMTFAALIPVFGSAAYAFELEIVQGLDLTPISMFFTLVLIIYSISRDQLLSSIPVSRHVLIEGLDDGILVVDSLGHVVDQNQAVSQFTDYVLCSRGSQIEQVFYRFPNVTEALKDGEKSQIELVNPDSGVRSMLVRIKPLFLSTGLRNGTLIVLHDFSERYLNRLELEAANQILREQLVEIELLQTRLADQVVRDPLTGLFNRRYLEETLPREIARSIRHGFPLTVAMIDIDHFKNINDRYGHHAGDLFLAGIGKLFNTGIRQEDFVCRYGGEEFLAVFPGLPEEASIARMEELRRAFEMQVVSFQDHELRCTFSAGIAVSPRHGQTSEALIDAADQALYEAKNRGRNRIHLAG